jgi:hypothetical protein
VSQILRAPAVADIKAGSVCGQRQGTCRGPYCRVFPQGHFFRYDAYNRQNCKVTEPERKLSFGTQKVSLQDEIRADITEVVCENEW